MKQKKIIYYNDLTDDFAGTNINTQKVGDNFPYERQSRLWHLIAWLLRYVIAYPIVFIICKICFGIKFKNLKALKSINGGCFLYANHTQLLDAFVPHLVSFPRKASIICGPDAVSIKGIKNIVQMLGGIPIPTGLKGMIKYIHAVKKRYVSGEIVAIYPEAHIWPYCTMIRPFGTEAFSFPVECNAPVFAMVTTYRAHKGIFLWIKKPMWTVTISNPMYPREDLKRTDAVKDLRDRVYDFMVSVASNKNNVEYIEYRKGTNKEE